MEGFCVLVLWSRDDQPPAVTFLLPFSFQAEALVQVALEVMAKVIQQ